MGMLWFNFILGLKFIFFFLGGGGRGGGIYNRNL